MYHLARGVRCSAHFRMLNIPMQELPIRSLAACRCSSQSRNRRHLPKQGPLQAASLASWPPPHLRPYVPKPQDAAHGERSSPDEAATSASNAPSAGAMSSKFPQFLREYGAIGVITHFSLSAVWYSSFYFAIKNGVDVESLLASIGLSPPTSEEGSAAVMAFVAYKLCQPLRFGVTVVVTPIVVRALRRSGHAGWPLPPKK